jgi:membrane associated rhomboid family serine protease/Flp pilus assembly protein TadD
MANCVQCGRKMPAFSFGKKLCQWCVRHEAAKRGETSDDEIQPVMAPPWAGGESTGMVVTQVIFGINAAVFLGMIMAGVPVMNSTSTQLIPWGANLTVFTLGGQWWRLLTYMFVHGDIIHIALNMWCLWTLGALAESLYGHVTFATAYLACGIGGGLASLWWHTNTASVGASGAVFGIAGALVASFYLGEFAGPNALVGNTLRSVVAFVGYNLLFGMFGNIDNAAHIGGLVTGLIVGALIAKVAPGRDAFFQRAVIFLFMGLLLFGGARYLERSRGWVVHSRAGAELLNEGRTDEAISQLQKAIALRPNDLNARYNLGQAYLRQRKVDLAEKEFKRALEIVPNDMDFWLALGQVYLDQNRTKEAGEATQRVLDLAPNSAEGHFNMGLVRAAQDNQLDAVEEFQRAVRLDPALRGASYNVGVAYSRLKRYDEAIAAYLQEKDKNGDSYDIEHGLAIAYRAKGMQAEAEAAHRKAEELKGKSPGSE